MEVLKATSARSCLFKIKFILADILDQKVSFFHFPARLSIMVYRPRWNRRGGACVNQMWDQMGPSAPPNFDQGAVPYGAVPSTAEEPVQAEVLVVERPVWTPPQGMFDGFAPSDIRGAWGPSMTAIPIPHGNDIYLLYGHFWKTPANIEKFGRSCGGSKNQQPGGSPKHIGLRGALMDAQERAAWRNLV